VLGAKPLTLLDYIANDKLQPFVIEQIILGMTKACKENGISLVGGETAEMPGTYLPGEHDLAGVITGVVEKDKILLGKNILPGDGVFAFPSSGLHTNGYSLARKLFFEIGKFSVDSYLSDLGVTVGEILLEPHLNYTLPVRHLLEKNIPIKGMAHITGGGILENIPRILPAHCSVEIYKDSWPQQALFSMLCDLGRLNDHEAYRTFNMGIGLVMIADASASVELRKFSVLEIGRVVERRPGEQVILL